MTIGFICDRTIMARRAEAHAVLSGLTLAGADGYDPVALSITVPGRHIPLTAIRDAATAIYAAAVRTPLVRLESGTGLGGARAEDPSPTHLYPDVYLKLEVLQPIGSFKIRGAYNVVRQLSRGELHDGVW